MLPSTSRILLLLALLLPLSSCLRLLKPSRDFAAYTPAPAPDYAQPGAWAALPTGHNASHDIPVRSTLRDQQATAAADVFFVHPTTYFWRGSWNADVANGRLNRYTNRTAIRKQATVFNASARIYAPRYRQATLYSFFDSTAAGNSGQALELAYTDVRRAFAYYLAHYNQGRPIIIAGHSQGTDHATRLLHDFFDHDPALRRRLVAAYLIGFRVKVNEYQTIRPCRDSLATGCFVTYNSVATGHEFLPFRHSAVTNPLTWTMDTLLTPARLNQGGVSQRFRRIDPHVTDAQIHDGLLWVTPPAPLGYPRFLLLDALELRHSFHIADYSLFYLNLRENVQARLRAWQAAQQ